jgi:hypothetical protein
LSAPSFVSQKHTGPAAICVSHGFCGIKLDGSIKVWQTFLTSPRAHTRCLGWRRLGIVRIDLESFAVVANRAVELALIRADITSGAIGFGHLSIQLEGTIEVGNRTWKVSLRMPSDTPVKKGLCESRRDPNGAVQVAKGTLNISFPTAHGAPTIEGLSEALGSARGHDHSQERGIQLPGMGAHMSAIGIGKVELRVELNSSE